MLYFLPPHPQPSFLSIPTYTASLISSLPSLPPSLSLIPLSFFPSYSGSLHSFSLLTFTLSPIPFLTSLPTVPSFLLLPLPHPSILSFVPPYPQQPPFLPPFPYSLIHLFLPSLPLPSFPSLCSLLLYFPPYPSFIPFLPSCLLVSQPQNPLCLSFLLPSLSISLLSYCPFILSFFTTAMINNIDFSCY